MSILEALILGLIQGISEFLPISSSGHLVIAKTFFNIEEADLSFAIILHLGTLFAIIIAYREAVFGVIKQFFLMIGDLFKKRSFCLSESKYRYYIVNILIASVPAAVVGILFDDYIEAAFSSVYIVSVMFFVTAAVLIAGELIGKDNTRTIEQTGPLKALIIGLFQMCAIIPGLSRSGTTLTGGLICGLTKEDALELSFLMAIPAILGSLLIDITKIIKTVLSISLLPVAVGFITSLITGWLSIGLFKRIVKEGSIIGFSVYLIILSVLVICAG